ncbi:unnamed protein product [Rotaria socialis]|uniref:Kinesin light chain n=2 Tax=Rotaria socialis TaxID=392032 RepID=A0A821IBC4_9BILA|nr:unnamed protein product [Rotaria socialis]
MFIMAINPTESLTSNIPFAMIDELSAIPQEKEILFTMHTVFRINEISQMLENSRLWKVQLTITNDDDAQLTGLSQYIQREIVGKGWYRTGQLLNKVDHFNQVDEFYMELLKNTLHDNDRVIGIYDQLTCVKNNQERFTEAVSYIKTSLKINRRPLPEDHPDLAAFYNNIGQVYHDMEDYSKALEFYDKSHQILEMSLPQDHPSLTTSYNDLGLVYNNIGDYSKALVFYQKAYPIFEDTLSPNHLNFVAVYSQLGEVYRSMRDYSKTLDSFEKYFQILQITVPKAHPNRAFTYSSIGDVHR